jgi:hypothetical protein
MKLVGLFALHWELALVKFRLAVFGLVYDKRNSDSNSSSNLLFIVCLITASTCCFIDTHFWPIL